MNNQKTLQKTRQFEISLDLAGNPEAVWKALTDARELMRWFPIEAKVEPGEGGSIMWHWPDCEKWITKIDVWEPGQRLRLLDEKQDSSGKPVTLAMDFKLEGTQEGTQLRLVHSGFGPEAEWDREFNGISSGWAFELRCLGHYLERHRGKDRHMVFLAQPSNLDEAQSRSRILGPNGLLAEGEVEQIGHGQPYHMKTVFGEDFSGQVLVNRFPRAFAGVVPGLDDAVLRYEFEGNQVFLNLELWGDHEQTADRFQERWKPKLKELLA